MSRKFLLHYLPLVYIILCKSATYIFIACITLLALDQFFNLLHPFPLVIVVYLAFGSQFIKNMWKFNRNFAPIILRSGNHTSKIIVSCKNEAFAKELIEDEIEIKVSGFGGLAWLAQLGDQRARASFIEVLFSDNQGGIKTKISDLEEFKDLVIAETPLLKNVAEVKK